MKLEDFLMMIKKGTCEKGKLRIRSVYDFSVDDKDLDAILEALKQPNNVRSMCLTSNLSSDGIQKLTRFLENNTQIESLYLDNEYFSFRSNNENIEYFVPVIQKNKTLKYLTLSGIGVQYANTAQFFEALKSNSTIESLSLYGTCFNTLDVAHQIADLISCNTILKSLHLTGHWFEQECLGIIAASLTSNNNLKELDISGSSFIFKNEAAILFANELAKNINLKSIRLFNSGITASGTTALANSLLTNTNLTKLDLDCNSITKDGTKALAKALETNHSLRSLAIGVCPTNEGIKAFANSLDKNTSLTEFNYIDSYTTPLDSKDTARVARSLSRNKKEQEEQKKQLKDASSMAAVSVLINQFSIPNENLRPPKDIRNYIASFFTGKNAKIDVAEVNKATAKASKEARKAQEAEFKLNKR